MNSYEKRLSEIDALVKALRGLGHTDDEIVVELRKHLPGLAEKPPRTLGEHIQKSLMNPGTPVIFTDGPRGDGGSAHHEMTEKTRGARAKRDEDDSAEATRKSARRAEVSGAQSIIAKAIREPGKAHVLGDGYAS